MSYWVSIAFGIGMILGLLAMGNIQDREIKKLQVSISGFAAVIEYQSRQLEEK